jgi:hypothetical protein
MPRADRGNRWNRLNAGVADESSWLPLASSACFDDIATSQQPLHAPLHRQSIRRDSLLMVEQSHWDRAAFRRRGAVRNKMCWCSTNLAAFAADVVPLVDRLAWLPEISGVGLLDHAAILTNRQWWTNLKSAIGVSQIRWFCSPAARQFDSADHARSNQCDDDENQQQPLCVAAERKFIASGELPGQHDHAGSIATTNIKPTAILTILGADRGGFISPSYPTARVNPTAGTPAWMPSISTA